MRRLINRQPDVVVRFGLMLLPFVAVIIAYMIASEARLSVNPNDKLLPGWSTIAAAIARMAFLPDQRTGSYLLLQDTISSLTRLGICVAVATLIGGKFGILQAGDRTEQIHLRAVFQLGLTPDYFPQRAQLVVLA